MSPLCALCAMMWGMVVCFREGFNAVFNSSLSPLGFFFVESTVNTRPHRGPFSNQWRYHQVICFWWRLYSHQACCVLKLRGDIWVASVCEFTARVSEWKYVLNNSIRKWEKCGRNNEWMGACRTQINLFCSGMLVFQFFFITHTHSHSHNHTRTFTHTLPLSAFLNWNVFLNAYFYVCIWFAHASNYCSSASSLNTRAETRLPGECAESFVMLCAKVLDIDEIIICWV